MREFSDKKSKKEWDLIEDALTLNSRKADLYRARAITVGSCFGGTLEVSMRLNDGTTVWTPLHPPEVIELINTLSAAIGCHISIKPREDFASWRQWKDPELSGNLLTSAFPNEIIEPQQSPTFLGTSKLADKKLAKKLAEKHNDPAMLQFLEKEMLAKQKLAKEKEKTNEALAIKKPRNKPAIK